MNPGRYFMPNMAINSAMLRNGYSMSSGMGLIGRMVQGIRSINWSKFLNGTSKTLNVMNQTIPLIRQVKPMVGNVRSMIKLAHAFGNETNSSNNVRTNNAAKSSNKKIVNVDTRREIINNTSSDYPTFFV